MRNQHAVVIPERVDIVRSTLRLAGFKFIDDKWYLPKNADTRNYPIMWQKPSGTWMFNIWYYDNYKRWMREEKLQNTR